MKFKVPKDDGAWWVAAMSWICGWAAAREAAWEPLALAVALFLAFASAQVLRGIRRSWKADPASARRGIAMMAGLLVVPGGVFALYALRIREDTWALLPVLPALAYSIAIATGSERAPYNRVLGMVALTGVAPATYAVVTGGMDGIAWLLWGTLGGYFVLSGILVMARFRKSRPALWIVRVLSPAAAAAAMFAAVHALLSGVFLLLVVKAWTCRPSTGPADPRKVGERELLHSAVAMALVVAALWMGVEYR